MTDIRMMIALKKGFIESNDAIWEQIKSTVGAWKKENPDGKAAVRYTVGGNTYTVPVHWGKVLVAGKDLDVSNWGSDKYHYFLSDRHTWGEYRVEYHSELFLRQFPFLTQQILEHAEKIGMDYAQFRSLVGRELVDMWPDKDNPLDFTITDWEFLPDVECEVKEDELKNDIIKLHDRIVDSWVAHDNEDNIRIAIERAMDSDEMKQIKVDYEKTRIRAEGRDNPVYVEDYPDVLSAALACEGNYLRIRMPDKLVRQARKWGMENPETRYAYLMLEWRKEFKESDGIPRDFLM